MLLLEMQMQIPSWLLCLQLYETRLSQIHDTNHVVTGGNRYLPLHNRGACGFPDAYVPYHSVRST